MNIAIYAQGLKKQFSKQDQPAVRSLDLSIPYGQLFGLVGPDGAGKTTALRMLSSVMEPTSGTATIAGFDVLKNPEQVRDHVGYMTQNFSLYPDLTVIENLMFFADIHRMPVEKRNKQIEKMLDFTRLEPFKDRRAGRLSGGMKKKLALSCAMLHSPEILMLDEPSTGVDPVSRRELWTILANIVSEGVTVIVSTPYMDEAERCHQIGMLYNGQLLTSGTPKELEALLPYTILQVKASPRKEMRRIVAGAGGILQWRPVGDCLRLSIAKGNGQVEHIMKDLERQFHHDGLEINMLRTERPDMEDVFVNLVMQQRATV